MRVRETPRRRDQATRHRPSHPPRVSAPPVNEIPLARNRALPRAPRRGQRRPRRHTSDTSRDGATPRRATPANQEPDTTLTGRSATPPCQRGSGSGRGSTVRPGCWVGERACQTVLDGVPGKRRSGQSLGGCADLAARNGRSAMADDRVLHSPGPSPDLARRLGRWLGPAHKRLRQQASGGEAVAVQTCRVFFHRPLS